MKRCEQERSRAEVAKEMYTLWIEEALMLEMAEDEEKFKDFAHQREEFLASEVERRTAASEQRTIAMEEQEATRMKALLMRDESARTVVEYAEKVDVCREETLTEHNNE